MTATLRVPRRSSLSTEDRSMRSVGEEGEDPLAEEDITKMMAAVNVEWSQWCVEKMCCTLVKLLLSLHPPTHPPGQRQRLGMLKLKRRVTIGYGNRRGLQAESGE